MDVEAKIKTKIRFAIGQKVKFADRNAEIVGTIEAIQVMFMRVGCLVSYFIEYTDHEGDKVTKILSEETINEI